MAAEDEDTSKKVVLKKVLSSTAVKPGMKIKRLAGRQPMSKARASTQLPEKSDPKEPAAEGKKRKERVKKTMARVAGQPSMMEEEEEVAAPAPKAQKLMGDAIKSGAATSKPKEAPKAAPSPRLHQREIPGAYQQLRRTRPQCLRLLLRKMKKGKS